MAEEELGQERTEPASPRRREEARKQGTIAVSAELNTGVQLLVAALVLSYGASNLGGGLLAAIRIHFLYRGGIDPDFLEIQGLFYGLFLLAAQALGPLLALLAGSALLLGVIQSGFAFYPEILSIRWERLDPVAGFGKLFSWGSGIRLLTSFLKLGLTGVLVWILVRGRLGIITRLGEAPLIVSVSQGWEILMRIFLAVALALLVIGVIDYILQRVRVERQLRLTRQEAKEELKQEEGDPQIRARIRRLQREAAQRRMMQEVPKATVVITNPTHFAVALRYDRATMAAPRIVALGAGWVAEQIIRRARQHAVAVVPNPPLAQALYRGGKLDREIPEALYQAVAETLAFVYRLRGLSA